MPTELLGKVWSDIAAAVGPLGALAILLAYLFFRAYQRQARWTQEYLVKIIERNTQAQVITATKAEHQAPQSLPAGGSASPAGSSPGETPPVTNDSSSSTSKPPRRTYAC